MRRAREPIAWALLALTAITVIVSACQLFHLAGATIPVAATPHPATAPAGPGHVVPAPTGAGSPSAGSPSEPGHSSPVAVSAFSLRASIAAPQFHAAYVIAAPVLSVILVAFCGGVTKRARQVVPTVAVVQAAALLLGVISLAGAASSHTRPGTWFFLEAPPLAITATALVFTGIVLWSRDLWPAAR